MTFPDQSHINRIRDALWLRSGNGASVMVGSGFSRNAVPIRPGAGQLPTWLDIAIQLRGEMYPNDEKPRTPEIAPRIAQEYEAAFGRVACMTVSKGWFETAITIRDQPTRVC